MKSDTVHIGVDVSKEKLDVYNPATDVVSELPNDATGFRMVRDMARRGKAVVCCEPTGGCELDMVLFLQRFGVPVAHCDGYRVRHYALSTGEFSKNDRVDARMIARFADCTPVRTLEKKDLAHLELGRRWKLYQTLVDMHVVLAQKASSEPVAEMRSMLRAESARMERKAAKALRSCVELAKGDERMSYLLGRFVEIDGVAEKTAIAVIAGVPEIGSIGDAALPRAREELDALRAFAAENGAPGEIRHWDLAYWSRRRLEALYGYSSETLRPYLPFPRVLDGLFGLARELFGVAIEPCDGLAPVWHPDVRLFRVRDAESGAELAHFYLDPYSRPAEKQGGAWMDEICNRAERPDGSVRLPLALLCCNQAPPSGGKPSLMTLGEVDTLFHEFGHALQGMLTRVGIPEAAGIANVEWDAVELASQFLENWHDLPAQLRALSAHVGTGEPIPEDLIAKIQGAKTYNQGLATVRQLRFALADMDLHERVPCAEMPDAEAAWAAASARFALLPPLPGERFLNTFTHIFSGGYAAGYYSYMWADILAHDAFAAFEEAGLDDPAARAATGRRYAATVLALGGSRAPADVFRDFRGRDPDPAALLRHKGLTSDE